MSKVPHDSRTPHGELLRAFKQAEADNARLREAIKRRRNAALALLSARGEDHVEHAALLAELSDAEFALDQIAREGR